MKTYIQTGNVLLESAQKSKEKLAAALETFIEKEYGFDVTVFVVDVKEIEQAVDNNPFAEGRVEEGPGGKKLYVTFLSVAPTEENFEKLKQAPIGNDLIAVHGNILYFKLESKASESKLSNNLIESKLKLKATTRNWNVTLKLLELLQNHGR